MERDEGERMAHSDQRQRFTLASALLMGLVFTGGLGACSDGGGTLHPDGTTGDTIHPSSDAGPQTNDGAASLGDGTASLGDGARAGYCAGNGPPVITTDTGATQKTRCTGEIAQVAFRFAICTCEAFSSIGDVSTDAFDHTQGPYDPKKIGTGGAAGFNGALSTSGPAAIGGPLYVGGGGMNLQGKASVRGDLRCRGDIQHWVELDVAKDAAVDGNISGTGTLTVAGTLTQPAGKSSTSLFQHIGQRAQAPVAVPPPCDCVPKHLLDVAKLVHIYAQANDNKEAGFDAAALDGFVAETSVDVPCGRLYLRKVAGNGKASLRVTGRTALFVSGDVSITGGLAIDLASPSAELDLFIEGGLSAIGGLELGDGTAPSRVRVYVGGSKPIDLAGGSILGGNLYAPHAEVRSAGSLEVFGSLFARKVSTLGGLKVHYDRAILKVGEDCPKADPGSGSQAKCTSCRDCGNQACVAGVCGACSHDSDCCAPLLCAKGICVAPIL